MLHTGKVHLKCLPLFAIILFHFPSFPWETWTSYSSVPSYICAVQQQLFCTTLNVWWARFSSIGTWEMFYCLEEHSLIRRTDSFVSKLHYFILYCTILFNIPGSLGCCLLIQHKQTLGISLLTQAHNAECHLHSL